MSSSEAALRPAPLGVAVVGAGMVADLHYRALQLLQHQWTLIGFLEPHEPRAEVRKETWGCRRYTDLDALLDDSDIDAVLVLTPFAHHEPVAAAALAAGKHVLVEKPVGTAAGVDRLQRKAAASRLVCMPGHNYAYQPEFHQVRRLVRDGSLGDIRAMWISYAIEHREDVAARYSGVLDEVMTHHTYLTLALLGTPDVLYAGRMRPAWLHHQADDQAWMTWEYAHRCTAHLFASFAVGDDTNDPWTFIVKVLGTNGGATYSWRSATYRRPLGTLAFAVPAYEDSYVHELAAFAQAIRGDATQIVSPMADAAFAAELLALADRADRECRGLDCPPSAATRNTDRSGDNP